MPELVRGGGPFWEDEIRLRPEWWDAVITPQLVCQVLEDIRVIHVIGAKWIRKKSVRDKNGVVELFIGCAVTEDGWNVAWTDRSGGNDDISFKMWEME